MRAQTLWQMEGFVSMTKRGFAMMRIKKREGVGDEVKSVVKDSLPRH